MFCPYLKGTGIEAQGGHAEYMLMNADATYLIPDKVSYEQAAPIFCAGYTVYGGLRWADPQPHERVAVLAALGIGGLGHLAVQYAKAAGFETIAVSHSPDKDKMIRDLGADEVVRDGKGLAAAGGADVILSTSNSTKAMVDTRIAARRPTRHHGCRRGANFGLSDRSHLEAHSDHWQPAERPRISLRSA
jgi:alcohol dehydrogenase